jgi:hypothetical protein
MYQEPNPDHVNFVESIGFDFYSGGETCLNYVLLEEFTDLYYEEETPEGIPESHFRQCWDDDGHFDWDCCSSEEEAERSMWCPTRVTALYFLANITQFVLQYLLYFLIIAILFVILTPYFLRMVR